MIGTVPVEQMPASRSSESAPQLFAGHAVAGGPPARRLKLSINFFDGRLPDSK